MSIHQLPAAPVPRIKARWLGVVVAAIVVVAGTRVGTALLPSPAAGPSTSLIDEPVPPAAVNGHGAGSSSLGMAPPDERVAFWEPRVAADPRDYLSAIHLADAYIDRARMTSDLADLERAQAALDRAAASTPDDRLTAPRQAQLALALHEFPRAMQLADSILATTPNDLTALAVAGDARLETGDVTGAGERYDRLAVLAPSGPVWSRLARLAFLGGDTHQAATLVQHAIADAEANGFVEEAAFYQFQLGELRRATGDVRGAESAYRAAIERSPDYPAAMVGLALIREGQGRRAEAIDLLEAATSRLPTPEAVAALGDLHLLAGDPAAAEDAYALVERIGAVARATGSVYDRQLILFAADHDRGVDAAVAAAEAEVAVRPDIYGYDALAWALYRAGRLEEAAAAADRALALGTRDPRLAYHAGMIAAALDDIDVARRLLGEALAGSAYLPPLQVPIAADTLAALGGAR